MTNTFKSTQFITSAAFLLFAFVSACGDSSSSTAPPDGSVAPDGSVIPPANGTDSTRPTVLSSGPPNGAIGVPIGGSVTALFSEAMNPATINSATLILKQGTTSIVGVVTYTGMTATFKSGVALVPSTLYSASVTIGAKDVADNALAAVYAWSFTTSSSTDATPPKGPAPVLLGMAGDYAILAKSGIDTVPASAIVGNIGVSPIDSTAITGFSLTVDAGLQYSTSTQVNGHVLAPDYASPTASNLTTAVSNMETAYTDAAGRPTPDFIELGAGEIGGLTLVPGLYKWGTGVSIATDVTLSGGPNDVWIFQISGDVTEANGKRVNLAGGALPKNIFWQTFGQLKLGTNAHFEGIALCQTAIILGTGASVNGRLLAQTAVTLDANAVTQPAL